jgi:glucose/arabinose dehydrogenase
LRIPGALAVASALALTVGCGGGDDEAPARTTAPEPALESVGEFREPIFLAEPPGGDGTLYVAERAGTVRAIAPDGEIRAKPVLDLSDDVDTEGEGGLFSLAFAPDGTGVYVSYSATGRLVVERFEWNAEAAEADASSRRELLAIPHPNPIHWGGLLLFGPEGELYLGTGEGGPVFPIPSRAHDPRSPLGKLLRLDPRTGDPEVVALGLRNPWRYSFDRKAGDLWIGDVGDFTEEEVNHLSAREMEGADFGWPAREGTAPTKSELRPSPGAIDPVLTYSRSGRDDDPRCAITGGYVVRDPALTSLRGKYLYADFCEGEIMAFPARTRHPRRDREPTGLNVPRLASFAEDADGRIYVISLDGPVYRITEAQP